MILTITLYSVLIDTTAESLYFALYKCKLFTQDVIQNTLDSVGVSNANRDGLCLFVGKGINCFAQDLKIYGDNLCYPFSSSMHLLYLLD